MDNHEDYLDALTAFSRSPTQEIPPILEQYLNQVAKNGETLFQWSLLKPLIVGKLEQVIEELRHDHRSESIPSRPNVENVGFDVMHTRIMEAVHAFTGAPFTIQRLCELLIEPKRHYKRSDKFLRGLEKNVLVVSTVDPFGRKVVSESGHKSLVNGMDTNGSPFFTRDSSLSTNLPPVPGWVTTTVTAASQSNSAMDSNGQQRQSDEAQSQESSLSANGVPVTGGLASSVYADQGEQPQGVHAEEVVEETVVTMETNEVGQVATDGGEALAEEEEEEEEEMGGGEDTNASTSSSSSSSSEELASADTGEAADRSAGLPAVSSSSETEPRPWASIANERENVQGDQSPSSDSCSTSDSESSDSTGKPTDSLPSQSTSSPAWLATCPTSYTASAHPNSPSHSSLENEDSDQCSGADIEQSSNSQSSDRLNSMDESFGFESVTSASVDKDGKEIQKGERSGSDSETDLSEPSVECEGDSPCIATSTAEHTRTYAQVVASSSTDPFSTNIAPLSSSEECDSVAGLERLVDSVETCAAPVSSSSSSLSSPPQNASSPPVSQLPLHSEPPSSSPAIDPSSDSGEPQAKRCRLSPSATADASDVASSHSNNISVAAPTETQASSSLSAMSQSDSSADTTSDASFVPLSDSKAVDGCENTSDKVSCSMEGVNAPLSSVEVIEEDDHTDSSQTKEGPPSPLSQLSSSSDSQGFSTCSESLDVDADASEEKPGNSQIVTEENQSSEVAASDTRTLQDGRIDEPMEHD